MKAITANKKNNVENNRQHTIEEISILMNHTFYNIPYMPLCK